MGRVDGFLCYGIRLVDNVAYPWDAKKYDGDVYEWWDSEVGGDVDYEVHNYNI